MLKTEVWLLDEYTRYYTIVLRIQESRNLLAALIES